MRPISRRNEQIALELTGAEPEHILSEACLHGFFFTELEKKDPLTYVLRIRRRDYHRLCAFCEKRGAEVRVSEALLVQSPILRILSRPILTAGIAGLIALTLFLPTRVLFIRTEGNRIVPSGKILEAAENCGIRFGASRKLLRSQRIKDALLYEIPELQWAGIETSGCSVVIHVRERTAAKATASQNGCASIVASTDGYILSCTAEHGTLLVEPGQSVRAGQLLISGYTDCGRCILAQRAAGDVLALTQRDFRAATPKKYMETIHTGRVKRKISVLVRKKRIFLWKDSGIWDSTCGRMYTEYYITLPGGFQLPLALCVETFQEKEISRSDTTQEHARTLLVRSAELHLRNRMTAGKVLQRTERIRAKGDCFLLEGSYACQELIGISRQEQIGETNENS